MAKLVSIIKSEFYSLPDAFASRISPEHMLNKQQKLRADLSRWLAESTDKVMVIAPPDQRQRLTIKLKIQFHSAMCLLHQPSQAIVSLNEQAYQICFESATQRIRLFENLYEAGSLCHSWRTVQDMFLAGATMMYCVYFSPHVRGLVSLSSLARDFRTCSSMLSVGGEWWPSVREKKSSLERLAGHILEILSEKESARSDLAQNDLISAVNTTVTIPLASSDAENALASVISYDGQLASMFNDISQSGFSHDWTTFDYGSASNLGPFWIDFDQTNFEQATQQSRNSERELQEFIDNLSNS